jgi:hypothetical protein
VVSTDVSEEPTATEHGGNIPVSKTIHSNTRQNDVYLFIWSFCTTVAILQAIYELRQM